MPSRNGMSSPRAKYVEQNGPVNLAVMQNNSSSPHSPNMASPTTASPKDDRPMPIDQSVSAKDTANLLESFNNRLPYANNAAALANYYNPYYRYPLYAPAHHTLGRPPTMQRFEPYPFLPSVPYSTQQTPGPNTLGPLPISQQNGHKSHVERPPLPSLLPPLNATNPLIAPPPPSSSLPPSSQMYKDSSKITSHNTNNYKDSSNKSPNSPQNNNNVGFKVPSGKEGSLKHRILTRPYDKDGKQQRSPPGITNGIPLNR